MALKTGSRINFDKIGAYASAICAVHCVLTGLAIGLLSIVGLGFIGSPQAELGFIAITLTVGTAAVIHGITKHHRAWPALIFVAGLSFLLVSHFAFPHEHTLGQPGSVVAHLFSALGGVCLVGFHVVNQKLAHQCGCQHCVTGE